MDEVMDFLQGQFGKYHFSGIGNVVVQTQPRVRARDPDPARRTARCSGPAASENISVVVHEQAHQWWGDNVSVQNWRDVWLNEGFATWPQWRWEEAQGGTTAQQMLAATYNQYPDGHSYWTAQDR